MFSRQQRLGQFVRPVQQQTHLRQWLHLTYPELEPVEGPALFTCLPVSETSARTLPYKALRQWDRQQRVSLVELILLLLVPYLCLDETLRQRLTPDPRS